MVAAGVSMSIRKRTIEVGVNLSKIIWWSPENTLMGHHKPGTSVLVRVVSFYRVIEKNEGITQLSRV